MAPAYKLTYFNSKGLAEPSRMILAFAGVDYEDVRIEKGDWEPLKKNFPWGVLPVLEVEGMVISQSMSIARFLARRFDLIGSGEGEAAKIDEFVDTIKDKGIEFGGLFRETDEAKRAELITKISTESAPKFLEKIEEILKKNGGQFLVGTKWSWADFVMAHHFSYYPIFFGADYLDRYPTVKGHMEGVFTIPQIKAWIEKRPATQW